VTVASFARAIHGRALYPLRTALTALVGQAELDISKSQYINVDVVFTLTGLSAAGVLKRASRVEFEDVSCLIMHPLHVLQSRLSNLHELHEKQNEKGAMQLAMSINVGREFLREMGRVAGAPKDASRHPLQPFVSEIEKMALTDAGRKCAVRWGVHVADAIDPELIPAGPFWTKKWPTLKTLMSSGYAARFSEPAAPEIFKEFRSKDRHF
jgi:hypothetical protein